MDCWGASTQRGPMYSPQGANQAIDEFSAAKTERFNPRTTVQICVQLANWGTGNSSLFPHFTELWNWTLYSDQADSEYIIEADPKLSTSNGIKASPSSISELQGSSIEATGYEIPAAARSKRIPLAP